MRKDDVVDVVIVGAGFAGLYMLHRARRLGLTARVYEAGGGVGGTWYWNRYPGARCDIESMQYSYSFSAELEQDWRWSERFASQAEILRYAEHVADRFDLRRDIVFDATVQRARFDAEHSLWRVTTRGEGAVSARYFVLATGVLSAIHPPEIPGLADFAGESYHTGAWPHHPVSFEGKTVGLIGTGSSGIQATSVIAAQARHLHVFQRTPNFVLSSANQKMTGEYEASWKADYRGLRRKAAATRTGVLHKFGTGSALQVAEADRSREYAERWAAGVSILTAYTDIYSDLDANATAADFLRSRISEIVKDPKTAELLSPRDYPVGAKRVCIDNDFYATFNRDNVTLVDIRSAPIEKLVPTGLVTAAGSYDLDVIVYATGFDAVTGSILKIDIVGKDGQSLREAWSAGPRTYLGLMAAGFPNLFMVNGPGSPAALSNALLALERHVEFIADAIAWLEEHGRTSMEPTADAEDEWSALVEQAGRGSIFEKANSWFKGANVVCKPRRFLVYVGGFDRYNDIIDGVVRDGYRGFTSTATTAAVVAVADRFRIS